MMARATTVFMPPSCFKFCGGRHGVITNTPFECGREGGKQGARGFHRGFYGSTVPGCVDQAMEKEEGAKLP